MRSASGHRRYPPEQVGVLRQLASLLSSGRPISELIGEYKAGRLEIQPDVSPGAMQRPDSAMIIDLLIAGEMSLAEEMIDRLSELLSPIDLVQAVIGPALTDVGERWFRRECEIYQQRLASGVLILRLENLLADAKRANPHPRRRALVGTVEGDEHEGGVMMAALALELVGWRALPLGTNVPVAEYGKAVEAWRPDAVGLSFVLSRNINKRFRELSMIRGVPILVGGRSIINHQGLARRHGLIPLTGSLEEATEKMIREVEAWEQGHGELPDERP